MGGNKKEELSPWQKQHCQDLHLKGKEGKTWCLGEWDGEQPSGHLFVRGHYSRREPLPTQASINQPTKRLTTPPVPSTWSTSKAFLSISSRKFQATYNHWSAVKPNPAACLWWQNMRLRFITDKIPSPIIKPLKIFHSIARLVLPRSAVPSRLSVFLKKGFNVVSNVTVGVEFPFQDWLCVTNQSAQAASPLPLFHKFGDIHR